MCDEWAGRPGCMGGDVRNNVIKEEIKQFKCISARCRMIFAYRMPAIYIVHWSTYIRMHWRSFRLKLELLSSWHTWHWFQQSPTPETEYHYLWFVWCDHSWPVRKLSIRWALLRIYSNTQHWTVHVYCTIANLPIPSSPIFGAACCRCCRVWTGIQTETCS